MWLITKTLVCLALLAATATAGEAKTPRLDCSLKNVRWQSLPSEIKRVCVGPDGRIWCVRRHETGTELSVPEFQKIVETEFHQQSPQIPCDELALFEPGGRVWFYLKGREESKKSLLLGYDGKAWIDYPLSAAEGLCGRCLTRGEFVSGEANRSAGGAALFIGAHDVFRFDGITWLRQRITNDQQAAGLVRLAASPKGHTVLAWQSGGHFLWVFQKGKWSEKPLDTETTLGTLYDLIVTNDAAYTQGLQRLSLDKITSEADKVSGGVAEKIRALGDDNYEIWQRALTDLKTWGPAIRPQLEQALKDAEKADSPKRRKLEYRVRMLYQAWGDQPMTPRYVNREYPAPFGSVKVSGVRRVLQDPAGRLYALAQQIEDEQSNVSKGLVILDAAGRTKIVGGALESTSLFSPILTAAGNQVWWSGLRLLDLDSGKFADALPGPAKFFGLQAVGADGRLFLSAGRGRATLDSDVYLIRRRVYSDSNSSVASNVRAATVLVYTPGVPDTRDKLSVSSIPLNRSMEFCVADDGSIWAVHRDQGLVRFDGRQWRPPAEPINSSYCCSVAGRGGIVLVRAGVGTGSGDFILYRGEKKIASGTLDSLLHDQRKVIAGAFGPGSPAFDGRIRSPYNLYLGMKFAADRQGNIWSSQNGHELSVLVGDRWQPVPTQSLPEKSQFSYIANILPIEDGRRICVVGKSQTPVGTSDCYLIGEVKDGRITLTPALEGGDDSCLALRDAGGCLWILGGVSPNGGSDAPTLYRIGGKGVLEKHSMRLHGLPCLADGAGNVWFATMSTTSPDSFRLWRRGKFGRDVTIPGFCHGTLLVSDRPGSVYAVTGMGLRHLVADGPQFDRFRLDKLFSLDEVSGVITAFEYVKPGCFVIRTYAAGPPTQISLSIVTLPSGRD